MISNVSPLKNKRYVGELVGQSNAISLVGFDQSTQNKIQAMHKQNVPVFFRNCDIQLNRYTTKLEVVIKSYTKIEPSKTVFDIDDLQAIGSTSIPLSQLRSMAEYSKANVKVKVIDIKQPQTVGNNKKKQEVVIADSSDNCTLTLWENVIGCLELLESYSISKLMVRVFNGDYYLSLPAHGAMVQIFDDIDEVIEDIPDSMESKIKGATVISVKEIKQFLACEFCTGKVELENDEPNYGTCTKCSAYIKTQRCKETLSAKFMVETPSLEISTLVAYDDVLRSIVGEKPITKKNLMAAKIFDCAHNSYHVVTSHLPP